ncbi:hypothetical protein BUALT_Bualt05G0080800 [Buddleja alternifolia]|uniref:Uncharacterized protein n=1 Tax=Buddleja alternifolia TaxID=168488 RepID=A0AAV6XQZ0_9LAMI|nr:hypothetical protein BUALT_Bualt05G0080800 [Buddleja alternifolia]
MQFLMGLTDSFKPVRGQILLMKPLPSLEDAYSMVQQEERQMDMSIFVPLEDATAALLAPHNAHSLSPSITLLLPISNHFQKSQSNNVGYGSLNSPSTSHGSLSMGNYANGVTFSQQQIPSAIAPSPSALKLTHGQDPVQKIPMVLGRQLGSLYCLASTSQDSSSFYAPTAHVVDLFRGGAIIVNLGWRRSIGRFQWSDVVAKLLWIMGYASGKRVNGMVAIWVGRAAAVRSLSGGSNHGDDGGSCEVGLATTVQTSVQVFICFLAH